MQVLLVSTYDLGRQPFGLASPAAWLRREGVATHCVDTSRERLTDDRIAGSDLVAFYLPMHTATRLAAPLIDRVRRVNPSARIAAYGLYAPLNAAWLRERGVTDVLGPEAEAELVDLAKGTPQRASSRRHPSLTPDRSGLPPLTRYAALQMPDGSTRVVGSTDGTRGCKHLCRHCPIVPVYKGRFYAVPVDVVLEDIHAQVEAGAQHISFGDPDFLNGPTHAQRIIERVGEQFPGITYDVTIKIEHILQHEALLPLLARSGCLFITSAVESIDDNVLLQLAKGHTRAGFVRAVELCRAAGVTLTPTFVAFTPWTTVEGYLELLQTIEALDLVEQVAPIQLAIRLLVTTGSPLLDLADIRAATTAFDPASLTWPWRHADPRVDALQVAVMRLVGTNVAGARRATFEAICDLAKGSDSGDDSTHESDPAQRALHDRGVVLLRRAVGRGHAAGVTQVLLLATTTGYQIRSFGEAAGALGIRLVFASDRCDQLEDPWWDQAIPVRFHDEPASVRAVVDAFGTTPPHGILAVGDRPVTLAARLSEAFGLPGNPISAAQASRDKLESRRALQAARLPVPSFQPLSLNADPRDASLATSYPAVVKPLAMSGSRGVIRVDTPSEFVAAFERLRALMAQPDVRVERDPAHETLLVESFIPGREYAVEGVMTAGALRLFAVFDKPDPLDGPFFEETIYVAPSRERAEVQQQIAATVASAAAALGLRHGPVHAECRVNDRGVFVLEVAARPIGGLCSRALGFSSPGGVRTSLEEVLLRHAIGEDIAGYARERDASGVMMIPIPHRGIYKGVQGEDAARAVEDVTELRITAKPDAPLVPLPEGRSYLGFIFARAADPLAVERALRAAHATLRFTIEREISVV